MVLALYLVKVSLVFVLAAFAALTVARRASAATRHWILTVAVAGLLALPLLSATLPAWAVVTFAGTASMTPVHPWTPPVPAAIEAAFAAAPTQEPIDPGRQSTMRSVPWLALAIYGYGLGVCVLVTRLMLGHIRVHHLVRGARPLETDEWRALFDRCRTELDVRARVRLLMSDAHGAPMTVGITRPVIVLPPESAAWTPQRRRAVVLHELAHVVRRDCLTQVGAALACALYWPHPGTWWMARRLRVEREFACDDLVVRTGIDASDYATHLLDIAYASFRHSAPALAIGMAAPHNVERRIVALLDAARARELAHPRARAAALVACALLLTPIAAATADNGQQPDAARQAPRRLVDAPWSGSRFLSIDYWRSTIADSVTQLSEQMDYVAQMRELGYPAADPDVLFRLRQHGVTPRYIRALAAEGLTHLSTADLLAAASHGVSAEYVHEMTALGYTPVDVATLVRLRSHGVDADLVRAFDGAGLGRVPPDSLVRARSHGVTGEYVAEMRSLGYRWSLEDLVRASSHGVDAGYLNDLASVGYLRLPLDQLTMLRSHGVDAELIGAFQELGYVNLAPPDFATLRSHGITASAARVANDKAGRRLSIGELVTWRQQPEAAT